MTAADRRSCVLWWITIAGLVLVVVVGVLNTRDLRHDGVVRDSQIAALSQALDAQRQQTITCATALPGATGCATPVAPPPSQVIATPTAVPTVIVQAIDADDLATAARRAVVALLPDEISAEQVGVMVDDAVSACVESGQCVGPSGTPGPPGEQGPQGPQGDPPSADAVLAVVQQVVAACVASGECVGPPPTQEQITAAVAAYLAGVTFTCDRPDNESPLTCRIDS